MELEDGLYAIVKRDCPTCRLVEGVLGQLLASRPGVRVVCQDDPEFPAGLEPLDDRDLVISQRLEVEIVPSLLEREGGATRALAQGWNREEWERISGVAGLGPELPPARPGCASLTLDPSRDLEVSSGELRARRVHLGSLEDPIEACFARGWTDGLPVVPPTAERVQRMLAGTTREPQEVVAAVPPDFAPCTVEKVAVNAVLAGCRPEYMPVVLAAVEAACTDEFNIHGLLATTYFAGPVVIVNGPVTKSLGMNSGINALGQGNRANATIGRALQLVIRNVGGGRPGEVDRATLGNPGKYTFCFAEDEDGSPWTSLARERGVPEGRSAVTLFAGEGPRGVVDQLSRTPDSLARSLALALRSVAHPKLAIGFDALLVITPEHARVFAEAEWSKDRVRQEINRVLTLPGAELVRGAGDCAEGLPESFAGATIPKFRPDGLLIAHAGGRAGLFSAIIGGWINGDGGSQPVTREIRT